ncbi:tetratricopeptide repeat protein [Massilia sp. PWRC2]|uniref:tetratricopeptide repeat protein n=1 Tax=Massilia sp. PWRC2 TaxID=2804626 RepID=UPI003CFAF60C
MSVLEQGLGDSNLYSALKHAPVEIRDAEAVLMGRSSLATLIEHGRMAGQQALPAGAYMANIGLPTGTRLVAPLEIGHDGAVSEAATSKLLALLRNATQTTASVAVAGRAPAQAARQRSADRASAVFMCLFRGTSDFLGCQPVDEINLHDLSPTELATHAQGLSLTNRGQISLTMQLLQSGAPPWHILVPPGCTVSVLRQPDAARPRITMLLNVPLIDQLIALRSNGALSEAIGVAGTLHVADVLDIANSHPFAAIAAAYVLLRTGELSDAEQSIAALAEQCGAQPDLTILLAELCARQGHHAEAQQGFIKAAGQGLPLACTGLTYLVDRLSFYACAQGADGYAQRSVLRQALLAPERFALRCDYRMIFTNYTGAAPGKPGDEVWNRNAVPPPFEAIISRSTPTI